MPKWDATQYLKFSGERTQPVHDLVHRIDLAAPRRILDAGCGPGNSTAVLRSRWPDAAVVGLDHSPEMLAQARRNDPGGEWNLGDAASWRAGRPFDLVFSNAMLQWVPDHERVCRHLLEQAAPGGALAVQVPAHYDSPLHREIQQVSADPAWNERMEAARGAITNHSPAWYYDLFEPLAARIDIWETTYCHILEGPDAILEWFRGTGLRPYLAALSSPEERLRFEEMLLERYIRSYPRQRSGKVLFPFRRLFFVAYRES
ncbi:MAG TPA: methyltransferase domain-containing protein [Bryobacteraceae bacterium]|nr:methyltransferase domain-containing protein [Bryobacteraceae bacterium]